MKFTQKFMIIKSTDSIVHQYKPIFLIIFFIQVVVNFFCCFSIVQFIVFGQKIPQFIWNLVLFLAFIKNCFKSIPNNSGVIEDGLMEYCAEKRKQKFEIFVRCIYNT